MEHPAFPATGETKPLSNPPRPASASTSNALKATPPPRQSAVDFVFLRQNVASPTMASSNAACKLAAMDARPDSDIFPALRQFPSGTPSSERNAGARQTGSG